MPPVKGAGFLTNCAPDFMLTEVYRQARDNPIIRMSMDIREGNHLLFPGETLTIADFRRSGAIEATAGGVDQNGLAGKMANSIDTNRDLQATYQPNVAAVVRMADEARARRRPLMREANAKEQRSKEVNGVETRLFRESNHETEEFLSD